MALVINAQAPAVRAEEPERANPVALTLTPADPCAFERREAYAAGIMHYSTEMLWACEAIARRRSASIPLGDRLEAVAQAISRYHEAIAVATRKGIEAREAGGWYAPTPFLDADAKRRLATDAGVLAALAAIGTGF